MLRLPCRTASFAASRNEQPRLLFVACLNFSVTHLRRPDGRPFRLVDVNPRPVADIMSDLKVRTVSCGVLSGFQAPIEAYGGMPGLTRFGVPQLQATQEMTLVYKYGVVYIG